MKTHSSGLVHQVGSRRRQRELNKLEEIILCCTHICEKEWKRERVRFGFRNCLVQVGNLANVRAPLISYTVDRVKRLHNII